MEKIKGIYRITNKIDGKFYIGSSNDILGSRFKDHKRDLKFNRHNFKFQEAYNKYNKNINIFKFEILEIVLETKENLAEIEQRYLDLWLPYSLENDNISYNISRDAIAPMGGVKCTQKHKNNIGKSKVGIKYGEEMSKKLGESRKGKKYNIKNRKTYSPKGIFKHSEKVKSDLRIKRMGKGMKNVNIIEVERMRSEGKTFMEIGKIFNVSGMTIYNRLKK